MPPRLPGAKPKQSSLPSRSYRPRAASFHGRVAGGTRVRGRTQLGLGRPSAGNEPYSWWVRLCTAAQHGIPVTRARRTTTTRRCHGRRPHGGATAAGRGGEVSFFGLWLSRLQIRGKGTRAGEHSFLAEWASARFRRKSRPRSQQARFLYTFLHARCALGDSAPYAFPFP